jgi:FtsZ-interacting cell division protein ZipA
MNKQQIILVGIAIVVIVVIALGIWSTKQRMEKFCNAPSKQLFEFAPDSQDTLDPVRFHTRTSIQTDDRPYHGYHIPNFSDLGSYRKFKESIKNQDIDSRTSNF